MEGEIITKEIHPDIYDWLSENILDYDDNQKLYTLTSEGKINIYCSVYLKYDITQFKYPFGYVKGDFYCNTCQYLISFIGLPKHIEGNIILNNNHFSNVSSFEKRYNLYIDMWFELLDSVSTEEMLKYINNYKDKVDSSHNYPIIPKEVINKYKVDFLLKELNHGR